MCSLVEVNRNSWDVDKGQCTLESLTKDFFFIHKKNALLVMRPEFKKTRTEEYLFGNFTDPVKYTNDNYFTSRVAFGMIKNSVLFVNVRNILERLLEAGLVKRESGFILKEYTNLYKIYERKKTQIILSWNYLYAGFYVWFGAVLISSLAFVCELIHSKLKNSSQNHKIVSSNTRH